MTCWFEFDDILTYGTKDVPRRRFPAMDARSCLNKASHILDLDGVPTVEDEMLLCLDVCDKIEAVLVGDKGDGMCAVGDDAETDEVCDLVGGGALDADVLYLHAAIHVEGFTLEQGGELDADEPASVVKGNDAQSLSKQLLCLVAKVFKLHSSFFFLLLLLLLLLLRFGDCWGHWLALLRLSLCVVCACVALRLVRPSFALLLRCCWHETTRKAERCVASCAFCGGDERRRD